MSFIQPLFLLGLLAAAVPIIVHLINRRKATHQPFPAMKLLQQSNKRVARSIKVRQWILLVLRVLAVVLLALALAKPYFLSSTGLTAEERMPTAVAFVIDNGLSMGHGDWWVQARRNFDAQMSSLRPWDEVVLITSTTQDTNRLTSDHGEVRRAFGALEISQQRGELTGAMMAASEILSTSQLPNRRVVVISDFAQSKISATAAPETPIPHDVELISVRGDKVDPGAAVKNFAVVDVQYEQDGAPQERTWKIDATIRNFGDADASRVPVRLSVAGDVVASDIISIEAGKSAVHTFRHRIEAGGVQKAVIELIDADELAADNVRHFTIHPRERVRALLVNGKPSSVPQNDELFFLTRALAPGGAGKGESTIIPSVTTVDGLDSRELSAFDVVLLANVPRLSAAAVAKLQSFVEDGGGLFISMGDQIDPALYNQQLGALLPKPLRNLKLLAERDDPDAPVKNTRFGHTRREHPVFRVFSLPGGASIQSVQVSSYMLLEPSPVDEHSAILMTFQDNAPALLERTVGRGRVLLLTTSVDREWTDFPVRTAYLPLMRRAMMYLARRSSSGGGSGEVVGSRVRVDVAGLVKERGIIHTPEGGRIVLEPLDGELTFVPETTGVYEFWADTDEVNASEAAAPRNRLDQFTMAVNVDTRASDLRLMSEDALAPWIDTDGHELIAGQGDANQRRVNLWSTILFLITLVLLFETIIGTRRSVLVAIGRRITFRKDPSLEV